MSSPWSSHVRYHSEKMLEHLRKGLQHVDKEIEARMGLPNEEQVMATLDDALGTFNNLDMQIQAFLNRFDKVPDKPEGTNVKETQERSVGEKSGSNPGQEEFLGPQIAQKVAS